ncbi:MAG: cupredoxin domain-containing protein, partial [Actinomycetota bacterium]
LGLPSSFFDFVPGVLVIPGALIAIIAGIGAIVAGRRGNVSPVATGGERTAIRTLLSVVVVLALVSAVLTLVSRSTVSQTEADTTVSLKNFEFDEASYELAAGSTVLVRNDDPFMHTFTVDALDIDIILTPGSEELVEIPAQLGEHVVFCRPHTTEPEDPAPDDMAATITIT